MGAPIRLHLPWKYGFKSVKSIVKVSFVAERPVSFWEQLQSSEYGFWANINPDVPHPRWSQAEEQILGTGERVPTQLFNGYGEFVASLYKGLENEKLYM
jgi:sulfoxide reductase catalytic subunit YedY